MRKLVLVAALASLALSACAVQEPPTLATAPPPASGLAAIVEAVPAVPAAPVVIADKVVLDEQVGIGVELAYKAVRLSLELAVDSGQLKGARAAQAQAINRKAYGFTLATQAAYRTLNAASYRESASQALSTIAALVALLGSK